MLVKGAKKLIYFKRSQNIFYRITFETATMPHLPFRLYLTFGSTNMTELKWHLTMKKDFTFHVPSSLF